MRKILCSTGALLGRPNKRDYNLLKDFSDRLNCDGYELLVYDTWFPEVDKLIETVKSFNLFIPVVHCEKAVSEKLAGAKVWYENDKYHYREFTPEEDEENFEIIEAEEIVDLNEQDIEEIEKADSGSDVEPAED